MRFECGTNAELMGTTNQQRNVEALSKAGLCCLKFKSLSTYHQRFRETNIHESGVLRHLHYAVHRGRAVKTATITSIKKAWSSRYSFRADDGSTTVKR